MTPFTGGAGTYTTSILSVPEPSSLVLALIGIGTALGVAWRARRGRTKRPSREVGGG